MRERIGAGRGLVFAAILVLLPAAARGQSGEDRARVLFRAGNKLYKQKDYKAALEKFREAKSLYPSYKIDINIGTTLSALGRDVEAAEHYEDVLRRAGKVAPRELVKDLTSALEGLRKKLAVIEAGASVAGATVEVDGKPVGTTPLQHVIYLSPGSHRVQMSKESYKTAQSTVELAAGDRKEVVLRLELAPRLESRPAPIPAPVHPPAPQAVAPKPRRWVSVTGWIMVGVGGAILITGAVLGGAAKAKESEYKSALEEGKTYAELKWIEDKGRPLNTAAIATLIAGGVVTAVGGGLVIWEWRRASGGERNSAAVTSLAPIAGPGTVGLGAVGRF